MFRFLVICSLAALAVAELKSGTARIPEIIPGEFNVPVNHFQPQDNRSATFVSEKN